MLQILLFFHILAVVMLFSGIALELVAFGRVHRAATLAQVRAATLNFPFVGPLMGIGVLILVAAGIAMVYVGGFGWANPWVNVTMVVTLILAVNGPVTNGKRCEAIAAIAENAGDGPVTPEIVRARDDWFLNYSVFLSVCELIAALFVMTNKPQLAGCITAFVVAAIVPAIPAMLVLRRKEPQPAT